MRPTRARRITAIAIALALTLGACSFNNGYVPTVTIDGGDRTLVLGEPLTLTATVTNRAGATNLVTWTSSDETVAAIDATGIVTTAAEGPTQITATSTSDPSKSDTITLTITEANAVTNLTIDGGDRTIVLGDPLTLTTTITTTGNATDTVTWTSSDETVATIDATGTVTSHTDGTTDLTATSVFDPTQSDTITLTVDPLGALRWTRQFGTSSEDYAYGIATDENGNVYVSGHTTGALEGPNAGQQRRLPSRVRPRRQRPLDPSVRHQHDRHRQRRRHRRERQRLRHRVHVRRPRRSQRRRPRQRQRRRRLPPRVRP